MEIKNIYCVGRNYADHATELGNQIPDSPLIFSKPTHSLAEADGSVLTFPGNKGEIHHELEVVLYIGKAVPEAFTVDEIVTKMALGIDFTLRDVQSELKGKGHPWLLAKGFKHAAVVTGFWDFPGVQACEQVDFSLHKNDQTVQQGNIKSMLFNFQTILDHLHQNFGLGEGDLIYTGTPEGVGAIADEDEFVLQWGTEEKGRFVVDF